MLAAQLPPNRGKLTIAGFAENYNMLADYYELGNDQYLTPEGKWADKQTNDTVRRIDVMHTPRPDYVFTVENGYLTGIRYEINIEGGDELLGSGEREMLLTALAFACAEDSIFSGSRNDIAKTITGSKLRDFSIKTDSAEIICQVSYSGYISSESFGDLMPEEGVKKTFICFSRSIRLPADTRRRAAGDKSAAQRRQSSSYCTKYQGTKGSFSCTEAEYTARVARRCPRPTKVCCR